MTIVLIVHTATHSIDICPVLAVIIVTTSQPFIIVAEAIVTLTAVFGGAEG
jgi:hypothetical protein